MTFRLLQIEAQEGTPRSEKIVREALLREKERIRATFGQYVDPRIVKSLLENRIGADKGERQAMTVFFSGLEGFTRLCESLAPDAAGCGLGRGLGGAG